MKKKSDPHLLDPRNNPFQKGNLWREPKYAYLNVANNETQYTFASIFENIKTHMFNVFPRVYGVPISRIDIPESDGAKQATKNTLQDKVDKRLHGYGILRANIDLSSERLLNISKMNDNNYIVSNLRYGILNIHLKNDWKTCPEDAYDWSADMNFSLVGLPRLANALFTFTVVTDTKTKAIELQKRLWSDFPIGRNQPIFFNKKVDYPGADPLILSYRHEAIIPDEIKHFLQDLTKTNDQFELCRFLQKFAQDKVAIPIDGGDRTKKLVFSYSDDIVLNTTSIEYDRWLGERNMTLYAVKWEFIAHYVEFHTFRLQSRLKEPNVYNPSIDWDIYKESQEFKDNAKTNHITATPVNISPFSQEISGTTIFEQTEWKYLDEDVYEYTVVEVVDNKKQIITKEGVRIPMKELTNDIVMNKYIEYILTDFHILDRVRYFNIEIQRTSMKRLDNYPLTPGNDILIEIDYDGRWINDLISKPGDKIVMAVYINHKHYNDWCIKNGFRQEKNLSEYN